MDIAGATKSAMHLVDNIEIGDALPFVTQKASWNIQINGAYNLLYPLMHIDFPNRIEIMQYISQKITTAFTLHNATHLHSGLFCSMIPDVPDSQLPVMLIPDSKTFNKYGEAVIVKNDPKYEIIGYGV